MDAPQLAPGVPAPANELLQTFESELQRYENELSLFEAHLGPVLQGPSEDVHSHPEEAPMHDLHEKILRLTRLNRRMTAIMGRLVL